MERNEQITKRAFCAGKRVHACFLLRGDALGRKNLGEGLH